MEDGGWRMERSWSGMAARLEVHARDQCERGDRGLGDEREVVKGDVGGRVDAEGAVVARGEGEGDGLGGAERRQVNEPPVVDEVVLGVVGGTIVGEVKVHGAGWRAGGVRGGVAG